MNNRPLIFAALMLTCVAWLPAAHAGERSETLRAINWVENPTNHERRGSKGELGPYQFRSQTWRMHTNKPFSLAVVREHADEVAIKHYEWIKRGLIGAGIDPSPFNIAMAWNSGLNSVLTGRVPVVTYNYAERVHNLVETQVLQRKLAEASRPAPEPPAPEAPAIAAIQFSLEPPAPRFVLSLGDEPLFEPTVYTDKRPATVRFEKPVFNVATVTPPPFALLP